MEEKSGLVRGLTLIAAASIVIGTIIGTGIFLKARIMVCNVDTPLMVLLVWVVAGLLSLAGTLTYAELAAMMPLAGGEYVFMREAYPRVWSFLYGWTQFWIIYAGSQAAKGVVIAIMLNVLYGGILDLKFFSFEVFGHPIQIGLLQWIAISSVWIATLINCAVVSLSGKVISFLTAIKVAIVFGIAAAAFSIANGDWMNLSLANVGGRCEDVSATARGGMVGFAAAMLGALWGYDGWSNLTVVSGEVKDPQKNIPRALIGGMLVVILLYISANLAYFYVLTPTEIADVSVQSSVATEVVKRFLGQTASGIMAIALLISAAGSLLSSILVGARIPYAMARDRLFFGQLGKVSEKTHVPIKALLAQAAWISVLTVSGSFDVLTDYAMFAAWIFYGLVTASIFILRRRFPDLPRPYRTWGYPVTPALFLIMATWLLISTVLAAPVRSAIGLALILIGLPFYWRWSRKI